MPPNFIVPSNNDYKMFHWHLTSYTQLHIDTNVHTIDQQQIDNTKKMVITYRVRYLYIFLLIIIKAHIQSYGAKMAIYSFQSV